MHRLRRFVCEGTKECWILPENWPNLIKLGDALNEKLGMCSSASRGHLQRAGKGMFNNHRQEGRALSTHLGWIVVIKKRLALNIEKSITMRVSLNLTKEKIRYGKAENFIRFDFPPSWTWLLSSMKVLEVNANSLLDFMASKIYFSSGWAHTKYLFLRTTAA